VILKPEDYLSHLDEGRCISIQAYAFVEATRSRPMQNCVKAHSIMFGTPVLEVEVRVYLCIIIHKVLNILGTEKLSNCVYNVG